MSDRKRYYFNSPKQEDGAWACIVLGVILVVCAGAALFCGPYRDWLCAVVAGLSGILVIFIGAYCIVEELKARMADQNEDDQSRS